MKLLVVNDNKDEISNYNENTEKKRIIPNYLNSQLLVLNENKDEISNYNKNANKEKIIRIKYY